MRQSARASTDDKIQVGVWQPPSPGDFGPLVSLEDALGRQVDIVPWYQAWDSPDNSSFRTDKIEWVLARGSTPMITWEPWNTQNGANQPAFSLRQITEHQHDQYIYRWARAAREVDGPIYLRFAHEMNGTWYPWAAGVNGNSSIDYVAAWIYVHDIFESVGATNVEWVWSPNRDYPGATPLNDLYPGDEYVDWVAIDGYNFGVEKNGMNWRSFNETFKATYDVVTALSSKPIMIGETASTETGGDKAAWIREGLSQDNLSANFPRLRAVVWFNQVGSGNWPLSTSVAAMQAFTEVIQTWDDNSGDNRQGRDSDPAPEPVQPPAAEPDKPAQTGRARTSEAQNPRQLMGAWWGTK